MSDFETLLFTTEFFETYADRRLTAADRAAFLKAMTLLDIREADGKKRMLGCTKHYDG